MKARTKKTKPKKEKGKTMGGFWFWVFGGLLCVLVGSIMTWHINRPFVGLHSLGQAHFAWVARSHVKYGLGYTKGLNTFAVGDPPAEKPSWYLDHPQLGGLLDAAGMAVLGVNVWSVRVLHALGTIATLLVFLKLLRRLLDPMPALLAGLLFCLFPLTGYFGTYNMWLYPLVFWAFWCYLVLIGGLKDGPKPSKFHKWTLAVALFLGLQLTWEGFFWALAIGVHYVFRCIRRRQFPDKVLLAILIVAPLSSLVLDFAIMAAGHGWDYQRIADLYKWRAGAGEMQEHEWGKWFAKFWEFAVMNFSWPVLILAVGYLTVGQFFAFTPPGQKRDRGRKTEAPRRFPHLWLFLLPAIFQLFLLKGTLWHHHYWERPLIPLIAVAAAMGITVVADILTKIHSLLAKISTIALVGVIAIWSWKGLTHYYSIRHFSPAKVKLFEMLNKQIQPDQALLSFESFIFDQHRAKKAGYRPEVAWYLDREVVSVTNVEEIQKHAQTGRFRYYLMPATHYDRRAVPYLTALSKQLEQRYGKPRSIQGDPGGPSKAPMLPYLIFDLSSNSPGSR